MDDLKVIDIVMNKRKIDNKELCELLYELFDAGDNPLKSLRQYTRIGDSYYFDKMVNVMKNICTQTKREGMCDIYNVDFITKDDIHNMVDVLPMGDKLTSFIEGSMLNHIIFVDFENYDMVYRYNSLIEAFEGNIKELVKDDELIYEENIEKIIDFIYNLDLFDVEMIE